MLCDPELSNSRLASWLSVMPKLPRVPPLPNVLVAAKVEVASLRSARTRSITAARDVLARRWDAR